MTFLKAILAAIIAFFSKPQPVEPPLPVVPTPMPPEPTPPVPAPVPPQPVPTPPPAPVVHPDGYADGTLAERKAMYQLASRVCDEEKLTPTMKRDLLLTIGGESGFNQWCVNHSSKDYGLCQFSARYYLVEYKMTPQHALDNPEECARIMARNFKAGRQSNWVAYPTRMAHTAMLAELSK